MPAVASDDSDKSAGKSSDADRLTDLRRIRLVTLGRHPSLDGTYIDVALPRQGAGSFPSR